MGFQPSGGAGGGGGVTVLNYTEVAADVTVSATVEGSATVVVTASAAVSVDGLTLICVEFYSEAVNANANGITIVNLFSDAAGGTSLGRLAVVGNVGSGTVGVAASCLVRRYFTPSAGSPTYSIRAWKTGTGTPVVQATAPAMPAYIRVSKGS